MPGSNCFLSRFFISEYFSCLLVLLVLCLIQHDIVGLYFFISVLIYTKALVDLLFAFLQ